MSEPSEQEDAIIEAAQAWRSEMASGEIDWDAHLTWLETDPRHARVLNALELIDAAVDERRSAIRALLPVEEPRPRRRFLVFGVGAGGVGAAAALALLFVAHPFKNPAPVERTLAAGQSPRFVALDATTSVTLSPTSSIRVRNAADLRLVAGEAYFDVKHDPARALLVRAGPFTVVDKGTRFAVNYSTDNFRVAVSQGIVSVVTPAGRSIDVPAGRQLVKRGDRLSLSAVSTDDVGSWREGRLSYSGAPLRLVVADIARYTGHPISLEPALENSNFSGSLVIGDGSELLPDLAVVVGGSVRRLDDGYRLERSSR